MNTMHSTTTKEYKVLLTHRPLHTQADGQQWRAMVLEFPSIVEEACSREEVLNQIKIRIGEMTRNAEVVILTAPALPLVQESSEKDLAAQGWDDHGLFRNDPEALQLFDAIEEERNRHQVGDV
jgi:predicted RNase H-like HicB family nuclease